MGTVRASFETGEVMRRVASRRFECDDLFDDVDDLPKPDMGKGLPEVGVMVTTSHDDMVHSDE